MDWYFILRIIPLLVFVTANKNLLVFNHLPKAGGTEIKTCLHTAFGHENIYVWSDYINFTPLHDSAKPLSDRQINHITHQPHQSQWLVLLEYQGMEVLHSTDRMFVIGSIREPCSYYLSDWAYKSMLVEKYNTSYGARTKYMGRDEHYASEADVHRFRQYINRVTTVGKDEEVLIQLRKAGVFNGGFLTQRFLLSYSIEGRPFSLNDVDCWVREEHLHADLNQCLQRYQKQGGSVPKFEEFAHYIRARNTHANPTDHKPCSYYYDQHTTDNVLESERFLYETFNMTGCCNPEYPNPNDRML